MSSAGPTPISIGSSVGKGGGNVMSDVIAVEMNLNAFIGTGNVKGRTKLLFTVGQMTDDFVSAIKAFQKHVVGLKNPDGRVDPNGKTLKYLNGPFSARGGEVDPDGNTPPADVLAARQKIAATARAMHAIGGHFLMGAKGDMPGRANGHPLRPAFTQSMVYMDAASRSQLGPAVNAAWCSTARFGRLGCMGRPDAVGITDSFLLPGNPALADIDNYMACIDRIRKSGIPLRRWPGFDVYLKKQAKFTAALTQSTLLELCPLDGSRGHFPRRINPDGLMHLGEGCADFRHYDCIGFIDFVLSKVLSPKWSQSMTFYMSTNSKFKVTELSGGKVFKLAEEGDLLFKSEEESHCGICTRRSDQIVVTNCRSMALGLIDSVLTDEWKFHARLINF